MNSVIGNEKLFWLPIVIFLFTLIIAIVMGIFKGWKISLYFLLWDFVALITGNFAVAPIVGGIAKLVHTGDFHFVTFLEAHPALVPIGILVWMLLIRFVGFIIYLIFFRSMLKGSSLEFDEKVVLSASSRVMGSIISCIGCAPLAIFSANASNIFASQKKNFFGQVNDQMVYYLTFTRYHGLSSYVQDFKDIGKLLSNGGSGLKHIVNLFTSPNGVDVSQPDLQKGGETHDSIERILNSPTFSTIVQSIDKNTFGPEKISSVLKAIKDLSSQPSQPGQPAKGPADYIPDVAKFNLPKDKWPSIFADMYKTFDWESSTVAITTDDKDILYQAFFTDANSNTV